MLQKIGFQPGINKQITETGAEGQWVDINKIVELADSLEYAPCPPRS